MSKQAAVTPQSEDFSKWYNDVIYKADLAAQSPVRGCIIIKPYGYELWEGIKNGLDRRFKATGHQNAYFPLLIPQSYLKREAEHVEGFSPELAIVTIAGGKELEEPLVIRPTSETIIGEAFAEWIQSWRDLPLLLNQWANVVRWELRTRPFLRTAEFLWQEGHTAHATEAEAEAETLQMLDVYYQVALDEAAMPVIKGIKSNNERFAGALRTYCIEGMMRDGKALQAGTSHNLGQNFAKAFNIRYLTKANELEFCWTTSWGMSTRMVGGLVMTHGDDVGLRLPPRLAPYQVVAVPVYKSEDEYSRVMEALERVVKALRAAGVRVHIDNRDETPGFKFNDWEMRGVPVRLEIGPKDLEKGSAVLARRDMPGKEGKQFVAQDGIVAAVQDLLEAIHHNMVKQATEFRDSRIVEVHSYDELRQAVEAGQWARGYWAGTDDEEKGVKEETGATLRCFPLATLEERGTCFFSGRAEGRIALFARAY